MHVVVPVCAIIYLMHDCHVVFLSAQDCVRGGACQLPMVVHVAACLC